MTRSTRRIIFLIATFIFLLAGYVAVLYAQGYRYDFDDSRFSRTGAISLRVNTQAQILLGGVVKDNTSFLTNSASISSLLPGEYIISVKKDGYSAWQKTALVQEGFVQDFPHVLILPMSGTDYDNVVREIQNLLYPISSSPSPSPTASPKPTPSPKPTATSSPSPSPDVSGPYYIDQGELYINTSSGPISVADDVLEVYRSPDNQKLIWISGNQIWLYWLNDQGEQPFHRQGDIAVIGRLPSPIKAMSWFRGSHHIVVDIGTTTPVFKILEVDTRGGQNIISLW